MSDPEDKIPPPKSAYQAMMEENLPSAVLNGPITRSEVYGLLGQLAEHLLAQRAQVKALEDRPELKYSGVWKSEKVYGSGIFVTDGGSMWFAQRASVGERPGSGDAWVLCVKRGRDAK